MRTQILEETRDYFVCYKPPGLAVETAQAAQPDVVSELKNLVAARGRASGEPFIGLVHRIDQPVAGLLVVAKNRRAAGILSAQAAREADPALVLTEKADPVSASAVGEESAAVPAAGLESLSSGAMEKRYRALVYCGGRPDPQADGKRRLMEDWLVKEGQRARIADAPVQGAKRARLVWQCLDRDGQRALLDILLLTGRFHQIRAQMAAAGMPVLGDTRYGSAESLACSARYQMGQIALQAWGLSFLDPRTGKRVSYELAEKISLSSGGAGQGAAPGCRVSLAAAGTFPWR